MSKGDKYERTYRLGVSNANPEETEGGWGYLFGAGMCLTTGRSVAVEIFLIGLRERDKR